VTEKILTPVLGNNSAVCLHFIKQSKLQALADPELQKRGGQILADIFNDLFLGVS